MCPGALYVIVLIQSNKLLDCIDLHDTRIKYYRDINSMEKLFNDNVSNIMN